MWKEDLHGRLRVLPFSLGVEITQSSFDLDTLAKWCQNIAGFVSGRRDATSTIPGSSHYQKSRHAQGQGPELLTAGRDLSMLIILSSRLSSWSTRKLKEMQPSRQQPFKTLESSIGSQKEAAK